MFFKVFWARKQEMDCEKDVIDGKEVQLFQNQVGGVDRQKVVLVILNLLKKELNPAKIAVHLNISKQKLQYYLSSLKKQGVIKKAGYGVWEVIPSKEVQLLQKSSHKGAIKSKQVKNVRGHAFIWKVRLNRQFKWIETLKSLGIAYELKGLANTPRIILNGKKVWLGTKFITVFEPKETSFFAVNPIEAKKEAVYSLLTTMQSLQEMFGDFKYKFTCKRQHYGFIDSKDADYFIKEGKKILIKNEKGYWFTIDFSDNLYREAETIHTIDADIDGLGYQKLMNSHEKTNWKVTPDFVLEAFAKTLQVQDMHSQNIIKHQKVLDEMLITLKLIQKGLDK